MTSDDLMSGKVSFDGIYDQPDPRAYYRTLAELDYQIPEQARAPFAHLSGVLGERRGGKPPQVLDVCCSYGINATLLNHDVSLAELNQRYRSPELEPLSSDELIEADRAFLAERRRPQALRVAGLDAAANAVSYAQRVGVLHAGSSENLEVAEPSDELQRLLTEVELITVTGGIGYVTEVTFDRLLEAASSPARPWIAAFSLRWVDMTPIAAVLDKHGYTLETLDGHTFRQRRFADVEERDHALAQLERLGLDPDGVETDGYHHTTFYLGRPVEEATADSVAELLAPVVGQRR